MPRRNNSPVHKPFTLVSPCKQKRRFDTESLAAKAATQGGANQPFLQLAVYKCDLCAGWHLTRTKNQE